jgi:hypothetical protein
MSDLAERLRTIADELEMDNPRVRDACREAAAALSGDYVRVPREPTEKYMKEATHYAATTLDLAYVVARRMYELALAAAQGREG